MGDVDRRLRVGLQKRATYESIVKCHYFGVFCGLKSGRDDVLLDIPAGFAHLL